MDLESLRDNVENSLNDTVALEGGVVTGFLCIVTYINNDGDQAFSVVRAQNQPTTNSLGMAKALMMSEEVHTHRMWGTN